MEKLGADVGLKVVPAVEEGEAGFVVTETLGMMGATVGGVAIGYAAGLAVGYVVDQTSQALGTMAKGIEQANDAAIDYWSSTGEKYNEGP